MDGNHPKRRKGKDNPYTIYTTKNGQYVSFKDGQGGLHNLKIDKPLYLLFDRFELEDKSYLSVTFPYSTFQVQCDLPKNMYLKMNRRAEKYDEKLKYWYCNRSHILDVGKLRK